MNPRRKKPKAVREAARNRVREELIVWLMQAHAVLGELIYQAQRWRGELAREANDGVVLGAFITPNEAAQIECALEEAISQVCSVVVPMPMELRLADPMAAVLAARTPQRASPK